MFGRNVRHYSSKKNLEFLKQYLSTNKIDLSYKLNYVLNITVPFIGLDIGAGRNADYTFYLDNKF